MTERQQLDRDKIEEAFRIVGQYLLHRKTLGEIAIYVRIAADCAISSVDQMLQVFQRFFANEELPLTARLRLTELIEAIQTRLS